MSWEPENSNSFQNLARGCEDTLDSVCEAYLYLSLLHSCSSLEVILSCCLYIRYRFGDHDTGMRYSEMKQGTGKVCVPSSSGCGCDAQMVLLSLLCDLSHSYFLAIPCFLFLVLPCLPFNRSFPTATQNFFQIKKKKKKFHIVPLESKFCSSGYMVVQHTVHTKPACYQCI